VRFVTLLVAMMFAGTASVAPSFPCGTALEKTALEKTADAATVGW